MMDQDHRNGEESSGSADPGSKCCTICGTTKTPLWRGGPSGPKSLCNACGIRYRKERREPAALKAAARAAERMKKERKGRSGGKKEADLLALLGLDAEALLKGRSALWLKRRRRLGEEEEAAVLLMALSSGFL